MPFPEWPCAGRAPGPFATAANQRFSGSVVRPTRPGELGTVAVERFSVSAERYDVPPAAPRPLEELG